MDYQRHFFDPPQTPRPRKDGETAPVYVFSDRIVLAVNVALATGRPLLIAGPPGSGKSTLARNVAEFKKWRYLQRVVTSRTQADDLLAGFDALRRLNDAQLRHREILPDPAYVEPGVLWWAYDPASARERGASPAELERAGERFRPARYRGGGTGEEEKGEEGKDAEEKSDHVVVLLDEMDKADPDVPNDLLEPLDLRSFQPPYRSEPVEAKGTVLVVITTNGERELPPAFMRRCVYLSLPAMDAGQLVTVAETHHGADRGDALYRTLADWLMELRARARAEGLREPGTAEYLDAVRACRELGVTPGSAAWKQVAAAAMWKHDHAPEEAAPADGDPATAGVG